MSDECDICRYPIFLELMSYTTDETVRKILENLSFGIVPAGIGITETDNTIELQSFIRKKERTVSINPFEEKPLESFSLVSNFFLEVGIQKAKKKDKVKKKTVISNWSDIKSQKDKTNLLQRYVGDLKNKNSLKPREMIHIYNVLNLQFSIKNITAKNVTMEDNRILNIDIDLLSYLC